MEASRRAAHHEIDEGAPRKVALFVTCSDDTMFRESAEAAVGFLERLGATSADACGLVRMPPGDARR